MKILIFSDIHGDMRALERVVAQPADTYISAGDLSNFGKSLEHCGEILKPLGERLLVLPGNHETHEQMRSFCTKYGFVDFHRQAKKLDGTNWAGLGYSNITPFKTPGEYTESQIAEALSHFVGMDQLYLVVHFPPRDTKLDQYAEGRHAGSPTLRAWVEHEKPLYLFCGHIHETAGMKDRLGATQCVNVGKEGYSVEV
jgi:Icc-related predicted phosphoesterase